MLQHLQISTTWAGSLGTASWPCPTFSARLSALSCSSHSTASSPSSSPAASLSLSLTCHSACSLLPVLNLRPPSSPLSPAGAVEWRLNGRYLIICVLLVILRRRHMLTLEWKAWLNPRLLLGQKPHESKFKGMAFFPPLNLFICSTLTTDKSVCFPWA